MSEWTRQTQWTVEHMDKAQQPVTGTLLVEGGALVFRDLETGDLVVAYGPGAWRRVWPL